MKKNYKSVAVCVAYIQTEVNTHTHTQRKYRANEAMTYVCRLSHACV